MKRILLFTLLTGVAAMPALAADNSLAVTVYRSSGGGLFDGGMGTVNDGYAVVHEQRNLKLAGGRETVVIGGLPATLDPEAVAIDAGDAAKVLAQRVLSSGDNNGLAAHRGEVVRVTGANGVSWEGTLVTVDANGIGLRQDKPAFGNTNILGVDDSLYYIRDYLAVQLSKDSVLSGSTLQLVVDGKAGDHAATLTYPTSGLGWRAAYSALLDDAGGCKLHLTALASIANRSGRDYSGAHLKLVAGEPNIQQNGGPHPMMMKGAMAAEPAPGYMPEQSGLGDYRSYTIASALDLPDASVTQVPLYAPRDVACERSWVYENGGAWFPPKPMMTEGHGSNAVGPVVSRLAFRVDDNLPAGNLRVLTRDKDDAAELLGESNIGDTPKNGKLDIALGNAFDLRGERERTAFTIDRAKREMSESFRISVRNSGEAERTVTVREHPNRWRAWELASSSIAPITSKPDLLEFRIKVPGGKQANIDYTIHYHWTVADE